MDRRTFLAASAAAAGTVATVPAFADVGSKTRWLVRTSEGFDALSFLSPLSGDPFYLPYYEKEVAEFAPRMTQEAMTILKALMARARQADILLSPFLDLRFSAGPDQSIDELLLSASNPDSRLLPRFRGSPYWGKDDEEGLAEWREFKAALPSLSAVLAALAEADFRGFRNAIIRRTGASRIAALNRALLDHDVIRWAEFYTGRGFEPSIEIILLQFSNPHGIKIIGQRFLNGINYPVEIPIRNAGHEVLHPPVPMEGEAAKAAMVIFEKDALLHRILAERDKSYGYGSIQGLFDEGLVKALDQLISERLGVPEDPRQRWRTQDGGMHILAAAFYGLMKQDGYARSGGDLEQWLLRQASKGTLAPKPLHAAAASVLDYPADQLWPPPKPPGA